MSLNEKQIVAIKQAIADLHKAAPEIVRDLFEDYHRIPENKEYQTGPGEAASGGGAEHMISQYSEPAKQVALAEEYKRVANMLADFPAIKAQMAEVHSAMSALLTGFVSKGRSSKQISKALEKSLINLGVLKATKAPSSEVQKAEQKIKDLRSELTFLTSLENGSLKDAISAVTSIKAEDEEEEEDKKEEKKEEEKSLNTSAEKFASYVEAVSKGDEAKEKDMEEHASEEEKKAFASVKASIKKSNDSHDAAGKFSETDAPKKDEKNEKKEEVKSEQLKQLQATVDEVAKSLASLSTGSTKVPVLEASTKGTVRDKVLKAISENTLPDGAVIKAKTLLQQADFVEAGKLGADIFKRNLELAPESVRVLFN